MSEKPSHLSENIYSIIHELLVPLKGFVATYSALRGKVPKIVEEPFSLFGQISNKLHTEMIDLYQEPSRKINLQSADIASEQIRSLSGEWIKDVEKISQLMSQINAKNVHLDDDLLNDILNGPLSKKGLEKFGEMVSYLTQVQAKHLILDDGFFYVLHIENYNGK